MRKFLLFILMAVLLIGCNKRTDENEWEEKSNFICSCPPIVYLQPLNGFSIKKANKVKKQLLAYNHNMFIEVEVLPNIKLGNNMRNDAQTRFRADKIINSFKKDANNHNIYVGLINDDISIPYKGKPDWGVLGFSWKGQYVSVVSTYRIKNVNRHLWKVVVHEFIHANYNYGHCPKDDPKCIMKDAKGHADFSNKDDLCDYCKKHI